MRIADCQFLLRLILARFQPGVCSKSMCLVNRFNGF